MLLQCTMYEYVCYVLVSAVSCEVWVSDRCYMVCVHVQYWYMCICCGIMCILHMCLFFCVCAFVCVCVLCVSTSCPQCVSQVFSLPFVFTVMNRPLCPRLQQILHFSFVFETQYVVAPFEVGVYVLSNSSRRTEAGRK